MGAATEAKIIKDEDKGTWKHYMYVRLTDAAGKSHNDFIPVDRTEMLSRLSDLGDLADVQVSESMVETDKYTAVSTMFVGGPEAAVLVRSFLYP